MPPRQTHTPDPLDQEFLDSRIVGQSTPMRRLKELLPRVARSRSSVLIHGESGTGKELVARAVHALSPRSAAPFVAENCAALPEGVIESELFGHMRGSFTGADRDREGLIALADGGTLFLDEVGDLPPRIQAKLLRVIQEGEFRPVGSRQIRRSDFRVISATHRDLVSMVREGVFRGDLFYRLNVIQVRIPPLRERIEDIPLLVEQILMRLTSGMGGGVRGETGRDAAGRGRPGTERDRDASGRDGAARRRWIGIDGERDLSSEGEKPIGPSGLQPDRAQPASSRAGDPDPHGRISGADDIPVPGSGSAGGESGHDPGGSRAPRQRSIAWSAGVSREAMEMLLRYPWPGNIRELQNVVESALVMAADGIIGVAALPERIIDHALAEPEGTALGEGTPHERVMVEMALHRFSGDKSKAARYIGWSRPKLYRVMSRYGISMRFGRDSV